VASIVWIGFTKSLSGRSLMIERRLEARWTVVQQRWVDPGPLRTNKRIITRAADVQRGQDMDGSFGLRFKTFVMDGDEAVLTSEGLIAWQPRINERLHRGAQCPDVPGEDRLGRESGCPLG